MAFGLNNNTGRRSRRAAPISDINITPFVDVLLVLLIIFMVAAPMMMGSVNIDLPKGVSGNLSEELPPISVSIKKNGAIYLQDEPIKLKLLPRSLLLLTNNNLNTKIFVRADKRIDYGRVMEVVKVVNIAGYAKVVLVTELVG